MIFATVGTQLPFARLLDEMDAIAADQVEPIIAQTGARQIWPNLTCAPDFPMHVMTDYFARARVIVGHAGIGTVLAAREARRPLIVLPRRAALGEHRNDHQMATAAALEAQAGVWVAWEASDLARLIDAELKLPEIGQSVLQDNLISAVREFALA